MEHEEDAWGEEKCPTGAEKEAQQFPTTFWGKCRIQSVQVNYTMTHLRELLGVSLQPNPYM